MLWDHALLWSNKNNKNNRKNKNIVIEKMLSEGQETGVLTTGLTVVRTPVKYVS